jgi:hypothetical protein
MRRNAMGITLRRRTQDVAMHEPPKQAPAQLELDISSDLKRAPSLTTDWAPRQKKRSELHIRVKSRDLTWHDSDTKSEESEVTVIAAWNGINGRLLGHIGRELTASRVRCVIRDAIIGHMGTVDAIP